MRHTSWSNRTHQSVHLDVPVFDVGARLAEFPLSRLSRHEAAPSNASRSFHKLQEANINEAKANVTLSHQLFLVHNHSFFLVC